MNKKGQKVSTIALATFVAGGVLSAPINVFASGVKTSDFTTDYSEIMCGYDRIYRDNASSNWIMEKPNKPESKKIEITMTNPTVGSTYTFTLMDSLMEKEIKKITGETQTNKVDFILDGDIPDGEYKLVGQIGNNEKVVKDITINGNIALDASITSNSEGNVNTLKDLTIANYVVKGAEQDRHENVTHNPPIEMTFDLKNKSEVSSLRVFSNNVNDHGPLEIEVYYEKDSEYKLVQKFSNLDWKEYVKESNENTSLGAPRKYTDLKLNNEVTTDSLKVKVTRGNTNWGNKVCIDEVMIWGHEIADTYKIELGQKVGTANTENTITIKGKSAGQYDNSKVKAELLKGQNVLKSVEGQFKDGSLSLELKTPNDIKSGEYTVKVTSDDGISKTFNYTVKTELTYEKNIDDQISVFSAKYTDYKSLDTINDGNYSNLHTTNTIKLWNKDVEVDETFSVRSIKVYANKDSFSNVDLKVSTSAIDNNALTQAVHFDNLEWQEDEKGSYVELFTNYNFLSHGYELSFDKNVDINEIDVMGTYFKTNLFNGATVTYNGKDITNDNTQKYTNNESAHGMLDNSVLKDTMFNDNKGQGKQEVIISSDDGMSYSIDKLFLSSNYIGKQGPKNVNVSYWQNGKWIEVEESIDNTIMNNGEQQREMLVVSIPHIESPKIKLDLEFNTAWGKGVITELNALGPKKHSVNAFAELVEIDKLTAGSTQLRFNNLDRTVKDWDKYFDIQVASSSNVSAVTLDGTVKHTNQDQISKVKLEVTNKETKEKAYTKEIEVNVPKSLSGNKAQADIQIDATTAYKNPAMGWVSYVEGFECAVHNQFGYDKGNEVTSNWNARNKGLCTEIGTDAKSAREYTKQMDQLIQEGMPCNIVYIREPWSWFEPEEGKYAWEDKNSACYEIVNWARKNNIQLAFRIITCSSACAQQATPEWVFNAGATGVTRSHDYIKNVKDPHLDNEVFKIKFKNFTKALGEEFNNEGTAFVDAHGHGQWGEMNAMVDMKNEGNRKQAIQYLEDCFVEAFPDVLLGGQQGSSASGGAIAESFDINGKNFVVRRDAFGSQLYLYNSGNANTIKQYRKQGIPVFAENCYHHFDSRNFRWSNKIGYSSGNVHPYGDNDFVSMKDMMNKVVDHALDCGANTIDLRTLEDAKMWMENGEEVLDRFTQEGGYRISVSDATYTNQLNPGDTMTIDSSWINNGVGIVPNNNKRWNKKMKVSFALIDENGKIVQQEIISTDNINVGDIDKDESHKYESSFKINENVNEGRYKLAVSVINTKDNNKVGIQLANKGEKTNDGWLTLGKVRIGENAAPTIEASDKSITVGDDFDPMKDVVIKDKEDDKSELKIDVDNQVDTQKVGVYKVTYTVTDTEGATTEKTIYVTVNPKSEVINHVPTIEASDRTITVGDKFNPLEGVSATDHEDKDLTSKIEVINNTVDTTKVGNYEVTYKVTDSQGASATKTITITVNAKVTVTPDSEKPNKTDDTQTPNTNETPKTDDMSKIGLFTTLFAGSGLVALVLGKRNKKNKGQ